MSHFQVAFSLCVKTGLRANRSYENLFLQEVQFHVNQTPFLNGFHCYFLLNIYTALINRSINQDRTIISIFWTGNQ